MNWLLLDELRNLDFSVIRFGVGSQLVVPLRANKAEATEFVGICTSTKAKSPCANYTVRRLYTDTYVERKFSFDAVAPKVRVRVDAVKKAALTRTKLKRH
ncbi:MAG: 50S ribosomal protein L19 [Candidatus Hodgkinia cicadicola]